MTKNRPTDLKRHHLPAAAIGYFSGDLSPARARERVVWVLRKDSNEPRLSTAERVGYMKRIYGYGKGYFMDHDDYFKDAESYVHGPVEILMKGDSRRGVDADSWVKLAWYITAQIARGPDLEQEVTRLSVEQGWANNGVTVGYPINAQRISAAVLRARWQFVYSEDRDFILGDRGIMGMFQSKWQTFGYFLPLRRNFGVVLGRAPHEKQLRWHDNAWHIDVEHLHIDKSLADKFNMIMWWAARQEVYGSSREQLINVRNAASPAEDAVVDLATKYEGAQLLGLTVHERMKDELLLFRLLGGIKKPGDEGAFLMKV